MDPMGLSPFDFHSIHLLALYLARLGCPWPGRLGSVGYNPNTDDGRHPASTSLSCSLQGFFTSSAGEGFLPSTVYPNLEVVYDPFT